MKKKYSITIDDDDEILLLEEDEVTHEPTEEVAEIEEEVFEEGIMFDGSSIAGWRGIQESDMTLIPDPTTATLDPFTAQPSLVLFCDVREPVSGQSYSRDPRSTAKKAEAYLKSTQTKP